MKKYKLWLSSLALVMALLMVNVSPVKVYANGDNPQGTSQKKATPSEEPSTAEIIAIIMIMLRMW